MPKDLFHKGLSLVLLFLFGFQSIGMSIDVHYCKGEIQSYSFFGKAEPCEMASDENDLHPCCKMRLKKRSSENGIITKNNSCCSNEMMHIELDDDFEVEQKVIIQESEDLMLDVRAMNYSMTLSEKEIILSNSDPPNITSNRLILFQSFLI